MRQSLVVLTVLVFFFPVDAFLQLTFLFFFPFLFMTTIPLWEWVETVYLVPVVVDVGMTCSCGSYFVLNFQIIGKVQ
jgi:hypothetical protein